MPYQVHFAIKPDRIIESGLFDRFYDAQKFAMQREKDLRPDFVAIREIASETLPVSIESSK